MSDLLVMGDLVWCWDRMAITEEKCDLVGVAEIFLAKGKKVAFSWLLGKYLARKPYN